jgi:hypothetical protein
MGALDMQSSSASSEWLIFIAILLAVGIGIACFITWLFIFRKSGKKRRKRMGRHHRKINPTLAETGGLPPPREPSQPPRGI